MISHSLFITAHACLILIALSATSSVSASPLSSSYRFSFIARQTVQPYFPDTPASCPICSQGYPSISTCAEAAPALANISSVRMCTDSRTTKNSCVTTFPLHNVKRSFSTPGRLSTRSSVPAPTPSSLFSRSVLIGARFIPSHPHHVFVL